jgi:hypothetical protein
LVFEEQRPKTLQRDHRSKESYENHGQSMQKVLSNKLDKIHIVHSPLKFIPEPDIQLLFRLLPTPPKRTILLGAELRLGSHSKSVVAPQPFGQLPLQTLEILAKPQELLLPLLVL